MIVSQKQPYVGQPIVRREDERFLAGLACYVDDVDLPNVAHIAFVRSPHARATLGTIDARAALLVPGVLRVLTVDDFPGRTVPMAREFPNTTGLLIAHPIFAVGEVRYVGQVVAAVVAESRAAAEDGAELVDVEYDPLEPVVDLRTASTATERVHSQLPENIFFRASYGDGKVEQTFRQAASIVSRRVLIPRVVATPIETRGALAMHDRGTDLLTIWCSAQGPHVLRSGLSFILDRPEDRIHVIVPDVGGSFGLKGMASVEYAIVARASIVVGRPVKWIEDRRESFQSGHHGRGLDADAEIAVSADGRFLALRARILLDCGAYLLPASPNSGHTAASLLPLVYDIPEAQVALVGVATNKLPTSPYRGAGRPEAAIIMEALVEQVARELGRESLDLRRQNLVGPEQFPYATATGLIYDSGNYPQLLDRLAELADVRRLREEQVLGRLTGQLIGIGVGMYVERSGGEWESASVSLDPGGRIIARIGSSPHGQGHETSFSQIVADALDAQIEDVVIRYGDSSEVLRGVGTFASRSMTMGGSAVLVAARKLRKKCAQLAAHLLDVGPNTLTWERGRIRATGRDVDLTFAELAAAAYDPTRIPAGSDLGLNASGYFASEYAFSSGAHLAVVEVDRGTGKVTVRRMIAVDDAGTIINPLLAEGQVLGGIAQGLGEALFEEIGYDEYGSLSVSSLLDYGVMTTAEMPPVHTVFCETPSPLNPLGVKGVGEGGACGAPAAVANAVFDALSPLGIGPLDMPFTAEKVWRALHHSGALR